MRFRVIFSRPQHQCKISKQVEDFLEIFPTLLECWSLKTGETVHSAGN
jgi:hypothetical protein